MGVAPLASVASLGALAATCLTVAACSNGSNPGDQITPPVDLGMTSKMAPYYQDQNLTMQEVQMPVPLPVRRPTAADYKSLGAAPKGTPYSHAPFLLASDENVVVHYTLSNLDTAQHAVWLLVDPWNEFVRWSPGVTVVSDEETAPNWGYDLAFVLPAQTRVDGTFTSDDIQEMATKLASVQNMLASPAAIAADSMDAGTPDGGDPNVTQITGFDPAGTANNIFNPQNRSNGGDPLYTPWIPPVIAGLTGFDLGLRTYEAANVAVEVTIEIKDVSGNHFLGSGSTEPELGVPPKTLTVPGAKM